MSATLIFSPSSQKVSPSTTQVRRVIPQSSKRVRCFRPSAKSYLRVLRGRSRSNLTLASSMPTYLQRIRSRTRLDPTSTPCADACRAASSVCPGNRSERHCHPLCLDLLFEPSNLAFPTQAIASSFIHRRTPFICASQLLAIVRARCGHSRVSRCFWECRQLSKPLQVQHYRQRGRDVSAQTCPASRASSVPRHQCSQQDHAGS